jgi:Protein of unknown function (DUF3237)
MFVSALIHDASFRRTRYILILEEIMQAKQRLFRVCLVLIGLVFGVTSIAEEMKIVEKRFKPDTEWVMSYIHTSTPPEVIGPTAEGLRFNIQVPAGQFRGDKLKGEFVPGGSARAIVRTDGVCTFRAHISGKTDDGALFLLEAEGTCDLGPDGYKQFIEGKSPQIIKIWVVSKISTAHPKYEWLNRKQFVQFGEIDMKSGIVSYDVYALK